MKLNERYEIKRSTSRAVREVNSIGRVIASGLEEALQKGKKWTTNCYCLLI